MTQHKIKELGWEVLPHPPYSPDIAPSDYHLFLSLSAFLSGKIYQNLEDVRSDIAAFFSSKPVTFYKKGIESLPQRWSRVIENDGNY
jgi:[histone H3]-lysine36 N-dimethyltransferase SETMAR